jgi:hypothetical protein
MMTCPELEPAAGQLPVHEKAAGVGNWDALVREGKIPNEPLPHSRLRVLGVVQARCSDSQGNRDAIPYLTATRS